MPELTPRAVEVRDELGEIAQLFARGDLRWQARLAKISESVDHIDDPFSRDDATMRVALFRHAALLHAGDPAGARAQLDLSEAALTRLGQFVTDDAGRRRHTDQLWTLIYNRAQLEQATGDFEQAAALGERCRALAGDTMDPAQRIRQSMVLNAATALARQDFVAAMSEYEQAVDRYRAEEPAGLSVVLLGLAQAQLMAGRLEEAERSADRAESLLGADLDQQLALQQLRAQLGFLRQRADSADGLAGYAGAVDERASRAQRQLGAQAAVTSLHASGDLAAAREAALALVDETRAGGDPDALSNALLRLAAVTQDLALTTHGDEGTALHHAALAALQQAADRVAHQQLPLQAARIEATGADFVAQWHPVVDGTNIQLLRVALDRARAAAQRLEAFAATAETAPERRDLAIQYSEQPVRVAFDLAFRLGEKVILSELIEQRAARVPTRLGAVGAGDPGAAES